MREYLYCFDDDRAGDEPVRTARQRKQKQSARETGAACVRLCVCVCVCALVLSTRVEEGVGLTPLQLREREERDPPLGTLPRCARGFDLLLSF